MAKSQLKRMIFNGLDNAPVEDVVKRAAKQAIGRNVGRLKSAMASMAYQAPEANNATVRLVDGVFGIIGPVFERYGVLLPDGQNAYRRVYTALGGTR